MKKYKKKKKFREVQKIKIKHIQKEIEKDWKWYRNREKKKYRKTIHRIYILGRYWNAEKDREVQKKIEQYWKRYRNIEKDREILKNIEKYWKR